ncbi:MAG: CapA family protein [Ignavibacteriales bacterium]|nr:CapA family protein [Ignavibacteriales bacterium]
MKNLSILFITTILGFQFFSCPVSKVKKNDIDSLRTVTISFTGDLMCHTPQMDFAKVSKDSFDFKPAFRVVKKYLSASDLAIGNLETTIAGKKNHYSGYPLFNSPHEYLDALKDAGFDLLLTANNHCLDRGKIGIINTIDKIRSIGMNSIGTYKTQQDRDSTRIFEINGIKIAVLAYTYGLNGNYISKKEKYLVNVIDTNLIKLDIQSARKKNAEVVLVYFHFGEEYQRKPNSFQKEVVKFAIDCGADMIIGSHPHVIQPLEYFTSNKNKIGEGFIAYSLGNFISNQRWRYSDAGVILNFSLIKNIYTGLIRLSNVSVLPTWIFKGKTESKNEFVILPADTTISKSNNFVMEADRIKLLQSNNDTRKMFESIQNHIYLPLNEKSN